MLTLGRELQRRTHVISRELWEVRHDLLRRHPTSEILEHVRDRDPRTEETRLTATHLRPNLDQAQQIHRLKLPPDITLESGTSIQRLAQVVASSGLSGFGPSAGFDTILTTSAFSACQRSGDASQEGRGPKPRPDSLGSFAQRTDRRCLMSGMDVTEPTNADAVAGADVESVWRDLGPGALRLAAVLVGPHDAHDITANAFLRVTSQAGWDRILDRRAYLLRAVRNEAQNLYRARGRRWRRDLEAVRPAALRDQPVDVDVYRALAELSLRQRSVVFLVYWHDMSEGEVGDVLGLSRGTVHRDLWLARDRLRKELS